MPHPIACIILAAGSGTRMKSDLPKPLHTIASLPMVTHVIKACEYLNPVKIVTVIAPDMPQMAQAVRPHETVVQPVANGTGGAALAAKDALGHFDGDVLIVFGDTPLVTGETLKKIVEARRAHSNTGVVYSAFTAKDPTGYGRMALFEDNSLSRIIEHKDANAAERDITLCNGGIVCANGRHLFQWLSKINNSNAQGEYYLVDLPGIAREDGYVSRICLIEETETAGVNSRADLARVENLMQVRLRRQAMDGGVTLVDPGSVFLSADTVIGRDVIIHPHVVIGPGVTIDNGAVIHAFSHLEGTHVHESAQVGPFARLRPGSDVGENAKVGNFVEIKNTALGAGSKASHLTYLGDAVIGSHVNIGAGTITCNYDGFNKYKTRIEDGAFIGSNTALVAPVTIGRNAMIAAGSTVTADVDVEALALARAQQVQKPGWAKHFKDQHQKSKGE